MSKKLHSTIFSIFLLLNTVLICSCGSSGNTASQTTASVSNTSPSSDISKDQEASDSSTSGKRGSTLNVLVPSADGVIVYSNDSAAIDASNSSEGYVMVNYTGSSSKVKLQIAGPEQNTYTYSLHGGYETFPLTEGNGTYHISVYENIENDQYATALTADIDASITNEFGPYLYPNQYVNYSNSEAIIAESENLASSADSDLDVVTNVYDYIIQNISYDYDKASNVQSGYLPDVDQILSSKRGICFDYAAVMASMLRVQGIPTRMELGYVGDVYHSWVSVYISEIGWVNGIIEFNGTTWEMMDPTFASTSNSPAEFVPTDNDYTLKYVY